jgi:hypothetical protein
MNLDLKGEKITNRLNNVTWQCFCIKSAQATAMPNLFSLSHGNNWRCGTYSSVNVQYNALLIIYLLRVANLA